MCVHARTHWPNIAQTYFIVVVVTNQDLKFEKNPYMEREILVMHAIHLCACTHTQNVALMDVSVFDWLSLSTI